MLNQPSAEMLSQHEDSVLFYRSMMQVLRNQIHSYGDPALEPLVNQVDNHLKHVTYNFRIASDSEDYPYELRRDFAYPEDATATACHKADRLIKLGSRALVYEDPKISFEKGRKEIVNEAQQEVIDKLLDQPLAVYRDFTQRREQDGDQASFPELMWTVEGLLIEMATKDSVTEACQKSNILCNLRNHLMSEMEKKLNEGLWPYKEMLLMIENAVEFFDIVVRVNNPDSPPIFHSGNFEYNWHAFLEDPSHIILPTMASVNSTDLIKLRGVPVGLIGVFTDTMTVDGYPQTPYEFFHHDVDHTRRMHEETLLGIEREGVTADKYAADATSLIDEVLLPAVDLEGIDDDNERDHRIAMRMILFEILHEDAYDPVRDTIADAILRDPKERMPFERLVGDDTVEYFMTQRATVLAHVYRKLSGKFYDFPEKRSTSLGSDFVRTRLAVAEAAKDLYRLVSDDPITSEALLKTCQDLVSTDENFSLSFLAGMSEDITNRSKGKNALRLGIARPLGVAAAVRKARKLKEALAGDDGHVHSLFGYSGLGYENPKLLEETIAKDLWEFDPKNTLIAIGATPYGIGRAYPIAKELGFRTLGIVASTALGRNEEAAEGVDEFIIVRDQGWGGFKYSQDTNGLLSPTTRVFVGASDSIAAYGGGGITAVTLEEMRRRRKPISFKPFDMNHHEAAVQYAQTGATDKLDYAGPAHTKWRELQIK